MIEPLRSQYLAALGIDNYVPRFILPGAKISDVCEWLEAPADVIASAAPIIEAPLNDSENVKNNSAQSIGEIIQRTPIIESAAKRSHEIDAAPLKTTATQINAGPQFALSIVLAGGGILLIDDAPASSSDRSAFQKLLNNMLPALRPAAAQYVLDIFIWPLTRQPKVPRDAGAAIETLSAYLAKQITQRAINTVLLLGEAAQQWCVLNENDARIIKSSSLLACVKDPALKRALWNDIRHLADPS